ncbi:MAG: uroporphyrinogen decarboxylase [Candidatus Nanopelagicales bacterium]
MTSSHSGADPVQVPTRAGLDADHPVLARRTDFSPLLRAAMGRAVPHTPVWFMRQAGRSLPEYRKVRSGVGMLESCFDADLVVEITDQPVRRHGVDAAILFSDIVVPLKAVGVDLDIVPGVGPVVAAPIRDAAGVAHLRDLRAEDVEPVLVAVRRLTEAQGPLGATPLIGFAGAPFTLASYLIEGGPSRDHAHTKALMYSDPALWHDLADRLARIAGGFLRMQVQAGASAVQLFDSWAGALPAADYRELVLPHVRTALGLVEDLCAEHGIPRILFGVGTGELLGTMSQAGTEVVGVDFRVPLDQAAARVRPGAALQGNLDPAIVGARPEVVAARVDAVLAAARRSGRGHIFNLGHGVLPDTDPDVLTGIVAQVHAAGPVASATGAITQ